MFVKQKLDLSWESSALYGNVKSLLKNHPKCLQYLFDTVERERRTHVSPSEEAVDSLLKLINIQWNNDEAAYLEPVLDRLNSNEPFREMTKLESFLKDQNFQLHWIRNMLLQSNASVEVALNLTIRLMNQVIDNYPLFQSRDYWCGVFYVCLANAVSFLSDAPNVIFPSALGLKRFKDLQYAFLDLANMQSNETVLVHEQEILKWLQQQMSAQRFNDVLNSLFVDEDEFVFFQFCRVADLRKLKWKSFGEGSTVEKLKSKFLEIKELLEKKLSSRMLNKIIKGVILGEFSNLKFQKAEKLYSYYIPQEYIKVYKFANFCNGYQLFLEYHQEN